MATLNEPIIHMYITATHLGPNCIAIIIVGKSPEKRTPPKLRSPMVATMEGFRCSIYMYM
jgi:hypothetical protein